IVVPEPVQVAQARGLALAIVDVALLDVGLVSGDKRARTGKLMRAIEDGALLGRRDWYGARPAAFGPGALEDDAVPAVGVARLELDGLFPAQAECLLELQAQAHVGVRDALEPVTKTPGLVPVGHKPSVRDRKLRVVSRDQSGLAHLLRPPAQMRQAVLERARREPLGLPAFEQRIDVLAFE